MCILSWLACGWYVVSMSLPCASMFLVCVQYCTTVHCRQDLPWVGFTICVSSKGGVGWYGRCPANECNTGAFAVPINTLNSKRLSRVGTCYEEPPTVRDTCLQNKSSKEPFTNVTPLYTAGKTCACRSSCREPWPLKPRQLARPEPRYVRSALQGS